MSENGKRKAGGKRQKAEIRKPRAESRALPCGLCNPEPESRLPKRVPPPGSGEELSKVAKGAPVVETTESYELLQSLLDKALTSTKATRAFLALVDTHSGELIVRFTAGQGWNEENRRLRLQIAQKEGRGITARVAITGQMYYAPDVNKDPYHLLYFEDVHSELVLPLVDLNGRTMGVLNLESDRVHAFTEDHHSLLTALANQVALVISMADHSARERALVEMGKDLNVVANVTDLMQRVVKVATTILHADDASLFVLDREKPELVLTASVGGLSKKVAQATYRMGEGLTGWVAEHAQSVRTSDVQSDPRWRGLHQEFESAETLGAFLAVPMQGRFSMLGVLRVVRRKRGNVAFLRSEFSESDEELLSTLASQAGVAVENARLLERLMQTERMAAWGEMSARAIHMVGNQVFAMRGHLNELQYLLDQREPSRKEMGELLESQKRVTARLEEVLHDFRDFVLATRLNLESQDVNDLLAQALKEYLPALSGLDVSIALQPDLPRIQADAPKLKNCFSELIEDAAIFQPEGGKLAISSASADGKEAHERCGLPRAARYVKVEFCDAGPGVPAENKSKIFMPFFSSRAKGLGLGLAIVRSILRGHRGDICEAGTHGEGARFVIYLPIA